MEKRIIKNSTNYYLDSGSSGMAFSKGINKEMQNPFKIIMSLLNFSMDKFNKKYAVVTTELNEMKQEITNAITYINNYISGVSKGGKDNHGQYNDDKVKVRPLSAKKIVKNNNILTKRNKESIEKNLNKDKIKLFMTEKQSTYSKSGKNIFVNTLRTPINSLISNGVFVNKKTRKVDKTNLDQGILSKTFFSTQTANKDISKIFDTPKINDNKSKALYLIAKLPITSIRDKINICFINKELYNALNVKNVLQSQEMNIKEVLSKSKEKFNNIRDTNENKSKEKEIKCKFPSKAIIWDINFLTSDKQSELMSHKDINLFNLLYCLSTRKEKQIESKDIIKEYNNLFDLYKVKNIKSLLKTIIYPQVFYSNCSERENICFNYTKSQMKKIIELISLVKEKNKENYMNFLYPLFDEILNLFKVYSVNDFIINKKELEKKIFYLESINSLISLKK